MVKSAKRGGLRKVVFTLVAAMGILGLFPTGLSAGIVPSDEAGALRADNQAKIQATLERKEIAARLSDYGLTPEEVSSRLDSLSDRQVAEVAGQIDQINAGSDIFGLLLTIALLILVVLVVLHLLGYIDLKLPRPKSNNP
jgi:hypothetical protein